MPTPLPLSPFVDPNNRFVLDRDKFMADIVLPSDLPAFLADPSPEYMRAAQIGTVLEVLAGR